MHNLLLLRSMRVCNANPLFKKPCTVVLLMLYQYSVSDYNDRSQTNMNLVQEVCLLHKWKFLKIY